MLENLSIMKNRTKQLVISKLTVDDCLNYNLYILFVLPRYDKHITRAQETDKKRGKRRRVAREDRRSLLPEAPNMIYRSNVNSNALSIRHGTCHHPAWGQRKIRFVVDSLTDACDLWRINIEVLNLYDTCHQCLKKYVSKTLLSLQNAFKTWYVRGAGFR